MVSNEPVSLASFKVELLAFRFHVYVCQSEVRDF